MYVFYNILTSIKSNKNKSGQGIVVGGKLLCFLSGHKKNPSNPLLFAFEIQSIRTL